MIIWILAVFAYSGLSHEWSENMTEVYQDSKIIPDLTQQLSVAMNMTYQRTTLMIAYSNYYFSRWEDLVSTEQKIAQICLNFQSISKISEVVHFIVVKSEFSMFRFHNCAFDEVGFKPLILITEDLLEKLKKNIPAQKNLKKFIENVRKSPENDEKFKNIEEIIYENELNKRKLEQNYTNDFIILKDSLNGCTPCAVLSFSSYPYLTAQDYDNITNELYKYMKYNCSDGVNQFKDVCLGQNVSLAVKKILEQPNFYKKKELCVTFNPNSFTVTNASTNCSTFEGVVTAFLDLQDLCLTNLSALNSGSGSSFISTLDQSCKSISEFFRRITESGKKPVNTSDTSFCSISQTSCKINATYNILYAAFNNEINYTSCVTYQDNIILQLTVIFSNLSAFSNSVCRNFYSLGNDQLGQFSQPTYQPVAAIQYFVSQCFSKNISVPLYKTSPSGFKSSTTVSKAMPYTLNESFANIKLTDGIFVLDSNCEDSNCILCNPSSSCSSCISGYNLTSSLKCGKSCPSGCMTCSNSSCLECIPGLCLDSTNTTCGKHQNCSICKTDKTCLQCIDSMNSSPSMTEGCTCNNGTYFNTTSGFCVSNISTNITSSSCYDLNSYADMTGTCKCLKGFYNHTLPSSFSYFCSKCAQGCSNCSSLNSCFECSAANTEIVSGSCVCKTGFYNESSICQPCSSSCASCTSLNNCSSCSVANSQLINGSCLCASGHFSSGGSCLACNNFCLICSNAFTCLSCIPNASLDIFGHCLCDQSFYNSSGNCAPCGSSCKTCDTANKCLSCIDQLAAVDLITGECKCGLNSTRINNGSCICDSGFFLNSAGNSCSPCNTGCLNCSSITNCFGCKSPLVLNSSQCVCSSGVYDLNAGTCNCTLNSSMINGKCICDSGFYLNSGTNLCTACDRNCLNCSSFDVCSVCKAPYFLNSSQCLCIEGSFPTTAGCSCIANSLSVNYGGCVCSTGFYLNSSINQCSSCDAKCNDCLSSTTCKSCKSPFVLNSTQCVCSSGFFLSSTSAGFDCTKCPSECSECNSSSFCTVCADKAYLLPSCTVLANISCNVTEFISASTCQPCNSSCQSCFGPSENECLSCISGYLQDNSCFNSCSLGYASEKGKCLQLNISEPVFRLDFSSSDEVFYERENNFSIQVSHNTQQRRTTEKPGVFASYKRGAYFSGEGYLSLQLDSQRLFSKNFAISVWLRTSLGSGEVLKKMNRFDSGLYKNLDLPNDFQYLRVWFQDFEVFLEAVFTNESLVLPSKLKLVKNEWNHIFIEVLEKNVSFTVNTQKSVTNLTNPIIKDASNSKLFIGGSDSAESSFQGFMYSVEVFSSSRNFNNLIQSLQSSSCGTCGVCPKESSCISTCQFNQFSYESSSICENCPSACPDGCKNATSCNLCLDDHCISCSSLEKSSCTECQEGFQVVNSLCESCAEGTFYHSSSKGCKKCPEICLNCTDSECLSCINNSKLVSKTCECEAGFFYSQNACNQLFFTCKSWISRENVINLVFSEDLLKNIEKTEIIVKVDSATVEFEVKKYDMQNFQIKVSTELLEKGKKLNVSFISAVYSVQHFLLSNTSFSHDIYLSDAQTAELKLAKKTETSKKIASTGATTGTSLALGISLLNFDPSSLFDFLNTAEIFYSVYLYNLELNPILGEFLLGLRIQKKIPNLFEYIFSGYNIEAVSQKYLKFGYKSCFSLMNIGVQLSTLIVLLVVWFLVYLVHQTARCRKKMKGIYRTFTFGVFLRFWIQSYLEILTATIVDLRFNPLLSGVDIFEYSLSLVLIVSLRQIFELLGVFLMVKLILKRTQLKDAREVKYFNYKFGTFFVEFNENGTINWMFYLLFILRRSLIILSFQFIPYGIFQLSVSMVFSMTVIEIQIPLYVIYSRCFKVNLFNFYHFSNEIIISVFNAVLFVSYIRGVTSDSQDLAEICVYLITATWGMNIGFSLCRTIINFYQKFQAWRAKKKIKPSVSHLEKIPNDRNDLSKTHEAF